MSAIAHPPVQCPERTAWAVLFLLLLGCLGAQAQEVIYRCGQEYTNTPRQTLDCERLATQAVTVITGTRPAPAQAHKSAAPSGALGRAAKTAPAIGNTVSVAVPEAARSSEQADRDAQAREVLWHELNQAQAQLAQLQQSFNQGEPEKWASESRHHQKYLDRVAALKAAIARSERDIDSLQRELARRTALSQAKTP